MTNLREQLAGLAGTPIETTTAQADADLARGRGALRRRRAVQTAAGSAFAVAVAAAAVAFTTAGNPTDAAPIAGAVPATAVAAPTTGSFQLVAYTGKQPAGFSVDRVPAGWEVQGIDEYSLVLAPEGAKPRNSAAPLGDTADTDPNSFVGKVAVMLQSVDEKGTPSGERVQVGGLAGTLVKKEGNRDGRTLYVPQPSGVNLQVQVWDGIGWSAEQIVEFAEGIHVNTNAKPGRG
ncbi:hypothetical protein [Actinoplanes teichomyceticus]|uniref:Uncharacterized protein n=1 Tax=Actinoplanes teichomyceticus TaxID=1867 RepID=A0A561WJA5_ACTTI|nr:hypothetical protein [Actinoplanes teichomyceticus]TWG23961.1 hypothetical protein FHX34_102514 [Actinoplanes teichomyceticus]GIF12003.1 hypothetical protein Ate01nite_20350 [Actinoplanes teichomyceticus]